MSKGNLFLGKASGKVGSLVLYRIANSNNAETQGTRAYQAQVTNPKTEGQALQRLKLSPALNFYRQLARILNNAWQGQKYGNKSRQYFMSLAMSQSTGIPFVVKGDKRFYPGQYPVAQGSLTTQSVTAIAGNLLTTSLVSGGVTGSWGEVSQGIVNANFGIKDGDKLTFIFVGTRNGEYIPAFSYVILDTLSEVAAEEVLSSSNLTFAGASGAALQIGLTNGPDAMVAGAVIVSRLDKLTGSWERSNATMFCAASYLAAQMGQSAYETAVQSYMNSEDYTSDWYLNAGLDGSVATTEGGSSNVSIVSVDNITVGSGGSSYSAGVATMSDGTKRALASNGSTRYVAYQQGGSYVYKTSQAADNTHLTAIKGADASVTAWLYVSATEVPDIAESEP